MEVMDICISSLCGRFYNFIIIILFILFSGPSDKNYLMQQGFLALSCENQALEFHHLHCQK